MVIIGNRRIQRKGSRQSSSEENALVILTANEVMTCLKIDSVFEAHYILNSKRQARLNGYPQFR
jgi:hypothetical protein